MLAGTCSAQQTDGSRSARLDLARRAHLPVSALGVGRLKGSTKLTAAVPRAVGTSPWMNAMGDFVTVPDQSGIAWG